MINLHTVLAAMILASPLSVKGADATAIFPRGSRSAEVP